MLTNDPYKGANCMSWHICYNYQPHPPPQPPMLFWNGSLFKHYHGALLPSPYVPFPPQPLFICPASVWSLSLTEQQRVALDVGNVCIIAFMSKEHYELYLNGGSNLKHWALFYNSSFLLCENTCTPKTQSCILFQGKILDIGIFVLQCDGTKLRQMEKSRRLI